MSEENLAALMPYRAKGLVGTNGLLLGLEWQSKLPEYFNPFESSDGQVITYRMLELGPNVTPDVSVMKQSEGRRASACPIDNWVGFQCGTIV